MQEHQPTKKTRYVVAGKDAGSKPAKAETLGPRIIDAEKPLGLLRAG